MRGVRGGGGWCGELRCPASAPGIPRSLRSPPPYAGAKGAGVEMFAPFAERKGARVSGAIRAGDARGGGEVAVGEGICGGCPASAPGIPRSLRSPPPYAGAKGASWWLSARG